MCFSNNTRFIVFKFSNVILIGTLSGCLLNTGTTSISKYTIVPRSEKSHSKSNFRFGVLTIVAAIGSSCKLLAFIIDLSDLCCVGMGSGAGLQKSDTLVISREHSPTYVVS